MEEQVYLLWPFAMVFLGTSAALRVAIGTVIAAPLIRIFLMVFVPSQRVGIGSIFPTVLTLWRWVASWLGVREQLILDPRYARFLRSPWFVLVPIAVFVLNYPLSAKLSALVTVSLLNIAIALCIDWCVRTPDSWIGKVLNWRFAIWIGALSYSLYLWQQPFLNRHSNLTINAVPLNLMLAIIAAVLSYYLIEKPFLRIKARFEVDHRHNVHQETYK